MSSHDHTTDSDPSLAHAAALLIRIDTDIVFSQRGRGTQTAYVAHDTRTGKFYRFGPSEYHVVTLLDGSRSLVDVQKQLVEDGVHWTLSDVAGFGVELIKHRLAQILPIHPQETEGLRVPDITPSTRCGPGTPRDDVPVSSKTSGSPSSSQQDQDTRGLSARPWITRGIRIGTRVLSQRIPLFAGDRIARFLQPWLGRFLPPPP